MLWGNTVGYPSDSLASSFLFSYLILCLLLFRWVTFRPTSLITSLFVNNISSSKKTRCWSNVCMNWMGYWKLFCSFTRSDQPCRSFRPPCILQSVWDKRRCVRVDGYHDWEDDGRRLDGLDAPHDHWTDDLDESEEMDTECLDMA